jgi:hypothetical protein
MGFHAEHCPAAGSRAAAIDISTAIDLVEALLSRKL